MTVPKKVINFLEKRKVKYQLIEHKTVYTAFDKSQTLKEKPSVIGKTLVLKGDRHILLALIPANRSLDKQKFKRAVNTRFKKIGQKPVKKISFASERLIKNKFPGVKVGALPPFGSMFGFPTFVNRSFLKNPKLIINSGSWQYSIKIGKSMFQKAVPALVAANFTKAKK